MLLKKHIFIFTLLFSWACFSLPVLAAPTNSAATHQCCDDGSNQNQTPVQDNNDCSDNDCCIMVMGFAQTIINQTESTHLQFNYVLKKQINSQQVMVFNQYLNDIWHPPKFC